MSDCLSAQLLSELDEEISENEDEQITDGSIEVKYTIIPGLRKNSSLIWAFEEKYLYYKNSYSKVTELEACKCYKPKCAARLYIRKDGSAYRNSDIGHAISHGFMYTDFKLMYCFNKMKKKAETALASTSSFQIYQEVVLE